MVKTVLSLLLFCMTVSIMNAQNRLVGFQEKIISSSLFNNRWQAQWISTPKNNRGEFGTWCFRKTFSIDEVPESFIIHCSADNQMKLYVNGVLVAMGPSRSDLNNWHYETIDIASELHAGENVIAAEVFYYSTQRAQAQPTYGYSSLMIQGNSSKESVINTNRSWRVIRNDAVRSLGRPKGTTVGPGEDIIAAKYPWGWKSLDYDDSQWDYAVRMADAAAKGAIDYAGRLLVPSPLPQMERTLQQFVKIRKAEGVICKNNFLSGEAPLMIPANTQARVVLDQGALTTAYLVLSLSGGKDAVMDIKYVEAYYIDPATHDKGNRNEIEGKKFQGHRDRIVADGGNRYFETQWWRTWRYVDITIETADEPLIVNKVESVFSAYPFDRKASLKVDGNWKWLSDVLDIGWRTARLCAHDMYMDCPYYEQLQYFGDTRIQAMVTMYNTIDDRLVKTAIEQGRRSLTADGLTLSRYPTNSMQIIPSFSLWWIGMMYDYWMMRGDEDFLSLQLPAMRMILSWWESHLQKNYSLEFIPYWFFIDWADGFNYGASLRNDDGNSAMQDVLFITALRQAAEMEKVFGINEQGMRYKEIADRMSENFQKAYWNEDRCLFAENLQKNTFSQHTNTLALLAGLVNDQKIKIVMKHILTDSDLVKATIYFKYYVNQALAKSGLGDSLINEMQIWRDQMKLGLTTWAETPEPSRSDCHAWGSSPNIELFRTLLGISSVSPGFKSVQIAPSLCGIKNISGSVPHPAGEIKVVYKVTKNNHIKAVINIPKGISGTFVWQGKQVKLHEGEQKIEL